MTRKVVYKETEPGSLWSIFLDGIEIEDNARTDEMDIADPSHNALWKALDVEVSFENHPDN